MPFLEKHPQGFVIRAYIQPRSSKNRISGIHGDALKICLTAPPVNDAANKMCVSFLAKTLGVPKSALTIVSGHSSRMKRILLFDIIDKTAPKQLEKRRYYIESRLMSS